jgi:prepilin-type processing-associated H-X9-DG protein
VAANASNEDLVARQLIKIYYCPSRRAPTAYGSQFGRCDYAGNAGIFQGNVHELSGDTPPPPIGFTPALNERTTQNFGSFGGRGGFIVWPGRGAKRTHGSITDGTSNSIAAAEKAIPVSRYGADGGDNERWNNSGWDEDNIRYHFPPKHDTDPTNIPCKTWTDQFGGPAPAGGCNSVWRRYFGSNHTGGLNAVFCDGSVRFLRFQIDPVTLMRLCGVDDGQVVDGSQF